MLDNLITYQLLLHVLENLCHFMTNYICKLVALKNFSSNLTEINCKIKNINCDIYEMMCKIYDMPGLDTPDDPDNPDNEARIRLNKFNLHVANRTINI